MAVLNAIVPIAAVALIAFMVVSRRKVGKADKAAREERARELGLRADQPSSDPTDPRERKL